LHDEAVRVLDRFPQPDRPVVDPAVGHDRSTGAFRAEAREGLREPAAGMNRDRQQLGGGHHTLSAPAVDPNRERRYITGTP
jgi:hypothetical protein